MPGGLSRRRSVLRQCLPAITNCGKKIYSPAELKKFEPFFDEAASLAKGDPGAEKRIAYFRKYILNTIREASEQYFRNAADVGKLAYDGKSLERGETIVIDGRLDDPAWKKAPEEWLVPFKGDVSEAGTRFRLMKGCTLSVWLRLL